MNNGRGHNAGNGNHNTPNRQIAQNTNAHHSGSPHFVYGLTGMSPDPI
jgi:hypothetical protein